MELEDLLELAFLYQSFTSFSLFCNVNVNNLRTTKNQDFYILNSILLFKTKNLEQTCAQVWSVHADLIGSWHRVATAFDQRYFVDAASLYEIPVNSLFLMSFKSGNTDQYAVLWRVLGEIFLVVYWDMELNNLRLISWMRSF